MDAIGEAEYEVEDILRYRRNDDGEEYFLVKWVGFSSDEATWEPLSHMNDNCRELVMKARALFAWRKPMQQAASNSALANEVIVNEAPEAPPSTPASEPPLSPAPSPPLGQQTPVTETVVEELDVDTAEVCDVAVFSPQPGSSPNQEVDGGKPMELELDGEPGAEEAEGAAGEELEDDEEVPHTPAEEPATPTHRPPPGITTLPISQRPRPITPQLSFADEDSTDNFEFEGSRDPRRHPANSLQAAKRKAPPETAATPPATEPPPAAPPKRPKLQAPSLGPPGSVPPRGASDAREAPPPTPTPPPTPPPAGAGGGAPRDAPPRPPRGPPPPKDDIFGKPSSQEMKSIPGLRDKINEKPGLVICRLCNSQQDTAAVESALGHKPTNEYVCPPCRLERVDEFHPPVGDGLLRHSFASASSTLSLSFTAQAAQWRKQQWAVHLRSVALNACDLGGPTWPHRVQGKLNGRQCVAIDPPKHLHVRREQCYNLTPLLRAGLNTLELRFTPRPDRPREEPDEGYCIGVVLTRPRSVSSILARIRTRSTETVSSGRARVERLIRQVARQEKKEDECQVTGNFGRMLRPLCPVSHCPIEESAIGKNCNHVQVFDLQAYIAVNQRMRSLDKRWTCPVCSSSLRPDDIVLDPFAQGILDTLRGDEDLVDAVVFNENCTWSTVVAVKGDDRSSRQAGAGDEQAGGETPGADAVMIDLSDSE